jgi:Post-segregation antitoxin CcdA
MRIQLTKGNVVLYLDKELVEKSRELGFNLSKTFKNHLKQFMMQFSVVNQVNTSNIAINDVGNSPGEIRTLVKDSRGPYA